MTDSWKDDNCAAVKAHYAVYSVPQAAALWCGVTEDLIQHVLAEVTQLSQTGFGRGVWKHPQIPCMEPRSRAIADAIESGLLPHGREDANPVANSDHVAYERRHVFGRDLKKWMEKAFPNEKPAFLFDDIERNTHTAISVDSYRALKADNDALQSRVEKAIESYKALQEKCRTIESERDALQKLVNQYNPTTEHSDNSALSKSQYWNELSKLASIAINAYPSWKEGQRKIQKSANLHDWLTSVIKADNREAEIIKKILSDFFQELR
jgi:hypothetical protein